MKVKKLGHCCFVVEAKGVRIMTDPGAPSYSGKATSERNISAILITHEHADHFHVDSVKEILLNNPSAQVITNTSVGVLLTEAGIAFTLVEKGQSVEVGGVLVSGFGNTHAEIYHDFAQVQNTGYMIDTLCYPGDAFHFPDQQVDILALPVVGPWMRMRDAIDYAIRINPRIAFPVHDGIIKEFATFLYAIPDRFLSETGIQFKKLEIDKEEEL